MCVVFGFLLFLFLLRCIDHKTCFILYYTKEREIHTHTYILSFFISFENKFWNFN
jgi:hypothetical protein